MRPARTPHALASCAALQARVDCARDERLRLTNARKRACERRGNDTAKSTASATSDGAASGSAAAEETEAAVSMFQPHQLSVRQVEVPSDHPQVGSWTLEGCPLSRGSGRWLRGESIADGAAMFNATTSSRDAAHLPECISRSTFRPNQGSSSSVKVVLRRAAQASSPASSSQGRELCTSLRASKAVGAGLSGSGIDCATLASTRAGRAAAERARKQLPWLPAGGSRRRCTTGAQLVHNWRAGYRPRARDACCLASGKCLGEGRGRHTSLARADGSLQGAELGESGVNGYAITVRM